MNCSESLSDWQLRNEQLVSRLMRAICDLDEERLNRRPDARTWSPAQVIEHLVLSNRPYFQTIKNALDRSDRIAEDPPVRFSFFGKQIARGAGPKGNVPSPKSLHPRSTPISLAIVDEWQKQQTELFSLIEQAKGVDLSRTPVRNPLVRFIRMNLADCFEILTAHTERHVGQIEERVPRG